MDEFRYNSVRAKKARAGRVLNASITRVLLILLVILGIGGFVYLVFFAKNAIGWLGLIPAIISLQLLLWSKSDLYRVPLGKGDDINDILSANVMNALGKNPTPLSFIKNLYKTRSGKFLAMRFGITKDFMEMVVAEVPDDLAPVFKTAREMRAQIDAEVISGGIMAAAIIAQNPEYERLLHERKLELNDLVEGVNWYNHLYGLVRSATKKRRDGGIARDFSFGWTPTLSKYSVNISESRKHGARTQIHLASHREIVQKMIEAFSKGGRQTSR